MPKTIHTIISRTAAALLATLSTAQAKAAVATGALASTTATVANADPLPWVVSALGALVVIVKFPAVTRLHGITNAVISVCLGGLGAESLALVISNQTGITPSRLLVAFLLSAMWPVAVAVVQQMWPSLRARAEKLIGEE